MNRIKGLLILIFFLSSSVSFCQSAPVSWSATAQKTKDHAYTISVTGKAPANWYVYATDDSVNQITGVELSWENERIKKTSALQRTRDSVIHDRIFRNKAFRVYDGEFKFLQPVEIDGAIPPVLRITIHGYAANGKEFEPVEEVRDIHLEGSIAAMPDLSKEIRLSTVDIDNPKANCGREGKAGNGLLAIFFLGIAGGFIALLTPCVFPMIPVTVSFFTNRSKTKREGIRNGCIYGASIFLIYTLASLPFHLLGNISPQILNTISTNAWVNVVFFFVFILFALSFFGVFEISLPSDIVTRTDSKSNLGSLSGIFFMALTLAAVSFSCTGPILGSLLVGSLSASGGAWQLSAGMAGFGVALALPFALFAMFPQWLKTLPKSGGWLDTVKKVLAFAELALAFKFLSNADLVQHWGILKREVFIGIWIAIAAGLSVYLFSKRLVIFGIAALSFALFLIPGISDSKEASLKWLSGFPPPLSYSIYKNKEEERGLQPLFINDYAKALELSKQLNKPLLVDFTGWACVNCRKMEEQIWTNPEVSELIKDKFILVSLYVDDRKKIKEEDQFTYKTKSGSEKEITTVGDKWATFQSENFSQVTQPMYVILNPGEQLMNVPVGYTPDAQEFKNWLECGLHAL